MGDNTAIEWTDASWTPIRARNRTTGKVGWHCTHASEGCRHCYSEGLNRRLGTGLPFKPGHEKDVELFIDETMLLQPLRWKRPRMIFVCSMTDLFADFVRDDWIDEVFAVMALAPQHTFQVLTKRARRMREYMTSNERTGDFEPMMRIIEAARKIRPDNLYNMTNWPLPNVWLGVSAEDQARAAERIPDLLATPAAIRFVSAEPLLGSIYIPEYMPNPLWNGLPSWKQPEIDWIIAGGESGPHARPMHPDWVRSLRDQCASAGVPFFFKQWGEWKPLIDRERDDPDWREDYSNANEHRGKIRWLNLAGGTGFHGERFHVMGRLGKRAAGRFLDGHEHNDMPRAAR